MVDEREILEDSPYLISGQWEKSKETVKRGYNLLNDLS